MKSCFKATYKTFGNLIAPWLILKNTIGARGETFRKITDGLIQRARVNGLCNVRLFEMRRACGRFPLHPHRVILDFVYTMRVPYSSLPSRGEWAITTDTKSTFLRRQSADRFGTGRLFVRMRVRVLDSSKRPSCNGT